MMWTVLIGLVMLIVVLILALAVEVKLDRVTSKVAIVAALFLSLALIGNHVAVSFAGPDPDRFDHDMVKLFNVASGLFAGAAWFFILVGLVRLASGQDSRQS